MTVVIRIKRLSASAVMPSRTYEGDAGFDLHADEKKTIGVLARERIRTGIALEMPPGFEGQVRPRSGLASEFGVTVLNAPGTVDSSFRGEIEVLLVNFGSGEFLVEKGQRIAQLVFATAPAVQLQEVDELRESARGGSGFGSSGR